MGELASFEEVVLGLSDADLKKLVFRQFRCVADSVHVVWVDDPFLELFIYPPTKDGYNYILFAEKHILQLFEGERYG